MAARPADGCVLQTVMQTPCASKTGAGIRLRLVGRASLAPAEPQLWLAALAAAASRSTAPPRGPLFGDRGGTGRSPNPGHRVTMLNQREKRPNGFRARLNIARTSMGATRADYDNGRRSRILRTWSENLQWYRAPKPKNGASTAAQVPSISFSSGPHNGPAVGQHHQSIAMLWRQQFSATCWRQQ
jgi:hypothetical protein